MPSKEEILKSKRRGKCLFISMAATKSSKCFFFRNHFRPILAQASFAQMFFALIFEAKDVISGRWCSNCLCESGPAEPRGMHSRSRRRRDRDRRHAILRAQDQSYRLKRLIWHRPRDVVAGATGQGDVDAPETMHAGCGDLPSATSPRSSEMMNLETNTLDGGSIDLTSSGLESISHVERSSVDVTSNTESGEPLSAATSGYTCSKFGETTKLEVKYIRQ